jgi:hypothetical protein
VKWRLGIIKAGLKISRLLVYAACGLASIFVLASGYESIYNRSLPYVHTLDPVSLEAIGQSYDLPQHISVPPKHYGQFGRPVTLKLPGRPTARRLDITPAIYSQGQWLARSSALHSLIPLPAKKGNIGMLLLYCRTSFRTIPNDNLPATGSNIFVDTDQEWRYVYKVMAARTINQSDDYIMTANNVPGKMLIACNDTALRVTSIIEADLISVQGVEQ